MQAIIDAFSARSGEPDLFAGWQEELKLRHRLRSTGATADIRITTRAQFDFLRRGLFYGPGRELFFDILFRNMSDQSVLTFLLQSDPGLIGGFLDYIAAVMGRQSLPAASLGFLIHIFDDDYQPQYSRLLELMDAERCVYLMMRTSNRELRRLFKERLGRIESAPAGDADTRPGQGSRRWPTLHGDKAELLAAAADGLRLEARDSARDDGTSIQDSLVGAAELLYRAGLLADCIGLLDHVISDRELERKEGNLTAGHPLHRRIQRLLGRAMPLHSLLLYPLYPRGWCLDNYRILFPGFACDPAALLYLDLYAVVVAAMQDRSQYARYELVQKAARLQALREDDPLPAALAQWGKKGIFGNIPFIIETLAAKMGPQPHEALAGLELLRYLHASSGLALDKPAATRMLDMYLQFFRWLPAAAFINDQLVGQLGPLAEDTLRVEAERIMSARQHIRCHETGPGVTPAAADRAETDLEKILRLSTAMGVY